MLVAKEVYLGFDEQDRIGQEDYGLWLRILDKTDALLIPDPLVLYDNRRNECDDPKTSKMLIT